MEKIFRSYRVALASISLIMLVVGCGVSRADPIRFVAGDIPPYVYAKDNGMDGVALAILHEMAKEMGEPCEVTMMPWKRAQLKAQEEKTIGIIPLARSTERETLYKWVGPLITDHMVIVTKVGGKSPPKTLDEAKDWIVGVLAGSPYEEILKTANFPRISAKNTEAVNANLLNADRIDGWLVAQLVAAYEYHRANFDTATLQYGLEIKPNILYLGLSKDVPDEVVAKWQQTLDKLKSSGKIDAIIKTFQ